MDAWFLGFTSKMVVGVYVGFDEPKSLGRYETGAKAALPVFKKFVKRVEKNKSITMKFINKEILPSNFFDEGMRSISLLGYKGTGLYALASLDIAFWDAHAKAANAPLAKVLGGSLEAIKAYNSRGLWLIDIKQIAHEAEALMKEGNFNAIKLRIGRETLEEDILAFQEVRRGTQNRPFEKGSPLRLEKHRVAPPRANRQPPAGIRLQTGASPAD